MERWKTITEYKVLDTNRKDIYGGPYCYGCYRNLKSAKQRMAELGGEKTYIDRLQYWSKVMV